MPSPKRAFQDLCSKAAMLSLCGDAGRVAYYLQKNIPLPEAYLPGRFLMRQSEEIRIALRELKSDDVKDLVRL